MADAGAGTGSRGASRERFPVDFELRDRLRPVASFLFRRWWRVGVRGLASVPAEGPAILVGNHSGAIPVDAAMLAYALDREDDHYSPRRVARILYDRFIDDIPVMAELYRRSGGVPARFAVADALLRLIRLLTAVLVSSKHFFAPDFAKLITISDMLLVLRRLPPVIFLIKEKNNHKSSLLFY